MKILVIHCAYNQKGGEDTVVNEEVKLLSANGNVVKKLMFNNNGNTLLKLLFLPFNINAYFKVKQKLRQFQPDIVHIHNLHFAASPSVIYAVAGAKIPCVVTLHNFRLLCPSASLFHNGKIFTHSLHSWFPWQAIRQKVYRNSAVLTLWLSVSQKLHQLLHTWEKCPRIIVLNDNTKQLLLQSGYHFLPENIIVKPNFCAEPGLDRRAGENYFLYVGRLTEEKGIEVLLHTFSKCSLPLKIAGDGPLREKVIEYASRYPSITYVGTVQKPDLFTLIQASTALIFPSIWYEGMPLTIIEAFACSTPVIASKLGAMENMIQDKVNGLHFEPGNETDLLDKISKWNAFTKEQKDRYQVNAYATYIQNYTPDNNYRQLITIYGTIYSKSASKEKKNFSVSY